MPRLLDLFCGAGGASRGYADVGFEVVGVDIEPQPHYPFGFVQANALDVLDGDKFWVRGEILANHLTLADFDAIHASPPCQDFSRTATITGGNGTGWLLTETLRLLRATGLPWVVENVPGAPLAGITLCGAMFGLQVTRHRLFEASWPLVAPVHPEHIGVFYSPSGHGETNAGRRAKHPELSGKGYADRCRKAMGIEWMNRDELAQAIPPAFTRYIGDQMLVEVEVAA